MEYVYAELIRNNLKSIDKVPKSKIPGTAVLLILSGDLTYDEVPTGNKAAVKAQLKARGYGVDGEPLEEKEG